MALHLREYENFVPITINNYYDKILEYLDDYDAAKRIASNGRMTYLKYHTTEIRMSELLQNLETLINGR
jgi:spore maturation protein CgeB